MNVFAESAGAANGQRGFGLLEVLVALLLLAVVGGSLFSWMNQSMDSVQRVQRVSTEVQLSLNAQALLADLNPLREPDGQRELSGLKLTWTSKLVQPVVNGRTFVEGQSGSWQVGLFEVSATALDVRTGISTELSFLRTGLKPVPGLPPGGGDKNLR